MTTLATSFRVLGGPGALPMPVLGNKGSLLQKLIAWYGERQRYRQTVNELSALSERELEDIGLTRGDILDVARRSARAF